MKNTEELRKSILDSIKKLEDAYQKKLSKAEKPKEFYQNQKNERVYPRNPEAQSKGEKVAPWAKGEETQEAPPMMVQTEKVKKDEMVEKDDKPHAPGTPEDKSHDVVESGEPLKSALDELAYTSMKKKFFEHLRTLNDPKNLRSEENQEAGKEPTEKACDKKLS